METDRLKETKKLLGKLVTDQIMASKDDAREVYVALAVNMLLSGVQMMKGINVPVDQIADIFLEELSD